AGWTSVSADPAIRNGAVEDVPEHIIGAVGLAEGLVRFGGSEDPLMFTQRTASPSFSDEGVFAGKTIGGLANDLRSGAISPQEVPVEYIQGDGARLIVNTRSSLALRRANIPSSKWTLIDRTGDPFTQENIFSRLMRNSLTYKGTDTLRITGLGKDASSL